MQMARAVTIYIKPILGCKLVTFKSIQAFDSRKQASSVTFQTYLTKEFFNWFQVPASVLKADQECGKQFSFQKMFNLEPLECNIKRDGRTGCILVRYQCEDPDDNGGSAVFPPGFGI